MSYSSAIGPMDVPRRKKGFIAAIPCWLMALAGSVFIGVTLPVALACWHSWPNGPFHQFDAMAETQNSALNVPPPDVTEFLLQCAGLEFTATIFCGPGALILGTVLYFGLKGFEPGEVHKRYICGICVGAVLAFMNFPGYLAAAVVHPVRMVALFMIAGATCGAWLAWQSYRAQNPQESALLPRFTLGTLMLMVFAWGMLLMIFAPRQL